jgi:hypothetical protein
MLDQLLSGLSKAVSYTFRKDGTRPGVLVSTLRDGSVYASVVRYGSGDGFKNGKLVVCKVNASDVETAIKSLSDEFLKIAQPDPNPIDVLRTLVKN